MRTHTDLHPYGAQAVSTRAWLYLGAVVLGLCLMPLVEPESPAGSTQAPVAGDRVQQAATAPADGIPKTPKSPAPEVGNFRAIVGDTPHLIGARVATP